tara:strand:+ start:103 stop:561 length:459 start_codon:yes stop_codon:yes gene_type:complete
MAFLNISDILILIYLTTVVRNYKRSAWGISPSIHTLLVIVALCLLADIGVETNLAGLGTYRHLARPVGVYTVKDVVIGNNLTKAVGGGGGDSVEDGSNKSIISIHSSHRSSNGVAFVCAWKYFSVLWSERHFYIMYLYYYSIRKISKHSFQY